MGIAIWVLKAYAAGPRELRQSSCHDAPPEKDPLRSLTEEERKTCSFASAAPTQNPLPTSLGPRLCKAVAEGKSYTEAAKVAGRRSGDAVWQLLWRFNREGLAALEPSHGGGRRTISMQHLSASASWWRRLAGNPTVKRTEPLPGRFVRYRENFAWGSGRAGRGEHLQHHLEGSQRGWRFEWQRTRSWCETGKVKRKRKKSGEEVVVEVTDPDAEAKKFRSNALTGRARRWASQCGESIKPVHCRRCLIPEVVAASCTVNPSANLISI